MVIDCAAATGLSRCDERIRAAAAATDEKRGQRRGDPRAAPPALGLAAAAWSGLGIVSGSAHSFAIVSVPALVVRMMMVFLKLISRPSPSSIVPLSNTW